MRKSDRKKLWALAGGRCSLCKQHHSEVELEEAHIVAREADGPRGDPHVSREHLDAYENLILLCPNCHSTVDGDVNAWTVEHLKQLKKGDESYIRQLTRDDLTDLSAEVTVRAVGGDDVAGARINKPTRIRPGTSITVEAEGTRRVTGVEIGGRDE